MFASGYSCDFPRHFSLLHHPFPATVAALWRLPVSFEAMPLQPSFSAFWLTLERIGFFLVYSFLNDSEFWAANQGLGAATVKMGVWSIDIICSDDALEVYHRMLVAGGVPVRCQFQR